MVCIFSVKVLKDIMSFPLSPSLPNLDLQDETAGYEFALRVFVYTSVLVIFVMVLALMLKLIGFMDDGGGGGRGDGGETESSRLLRKEAIPIFYGACGGGEGEDEDCGGGRSNPSKELYEENKICAICYDHKRCCFFVPCGHFATCLHCAKRISEGEAKICPFCRTDIHMIRRLFSL